MKPTDAKSRTYIDIKNKNKEYFCLENNDIEPKFKACGHVKLSKEKNISGKNYIPSWSDAFIV